MASLFYLGAVLAVIVVGSAVLALRAREPRGLDHTVREFQKEMSALSPEQRRTRQSARRGR